MSSLDNKISLLIDKQVPGFVQEDYPLFIRFIEAYYEFLEQKQTDANNDLYARAKELIDIVDIDITIDEFEEQFFNNFLTLFPRDTLASKSLLVKNSIPLYLAKGNEKSFKYFFKALFDEEVEILIPKNDVLIVSGGNWNSIKTLRVLSTGSYTSYTSNVSVYNSAVSNTTFYLPQEYYSSNLTVIADDVELTNNDFFVQREYKKLVLNTPIVESLKIYFDLIDPNLLINRKILGETSGASSIIEKVHVYKDFPNIIYELEINRNKLEYNNFLNGETFITDILNEDGSLLNIYLNPFSTLRTITIIDGGSSYNIGDQVNLLGGSPSAAANAEVSSVYNGVIDKLGVEYGGAGFSAGDPITSYDMPGPPQSPHVDGAIVTVDTTGISSANSFTFNNDFIWDLAHTSIDSANYQTNSGFSISGIPFLYSANANTRMSDIFSYTTINDIGPINSVFLLSSNATTNLTVKMAAQSASKLLMSANVSYPMSFLVPICSEGSVGRIRIDSGGINYFLGDKLQFDNFPSIGTGIGARGAVTEVNTIGTIKKAELQPFPPNGKCYNASIIKNSKIVTGNGSTFLEDFLPGQQIMIFNQAKTIDTIESNTSMTMLTTFNATKSNTEIGLYGVYTIGGAGYDQNFVPSVQVISSLGSGALLTVTSIMGDGEIIVPSGLHADGEILSIDITDAGLKYKVNPIVDLSQVGDGTATASANINYSYYDYPGKYVGTYGQLSSDKKIQDSNFFNTGAYVIKTKQQFVKFKNALLNLLHPAGNRAFCYYTPPASIITSTAASTEYSYLIKGAISPSLHFNFAEQLSLKTSLYGTGADNSFYESNAASSDSIISFQRDTAATYINQYGYVTIAEPNEPRFDYDPDADAESGVFTSRGLLIEEPRRNLFYSSQDFLASNTDSILVWGHKDITITQDDQNITSPDGTSNAFSILLTERMGSMYQSFSNPAMEFRPPDLTAITLSMPITAYARKSPKKVSGFSDYLIIWVNGSGDSPRDGINSAEYLTEQGFYDFADGVVALAVFNLDTGEIAGNWVQQGLSWSAQHHSIQKLKNGWYRCQFVLKVSSDENTQVFTVKFTPSSTEYFGDDSTMDGRLAGTGLYLDQPWYYPAVTVDEVEYPTGIPTASDDEILIWGVQAEIKIQKDQPLSIEDWETTNFVIPESAIYATSLITPSSDNVSSYSTRSLDIVSISLTENSWYNSSEGALLVESRLMDGGWNQLTAPDSEFTPRIMSFGDGINYDEFALAWHLNAYPQGDPAYFDHKLIVGISANSAGVSHQLGTGGPPYDSAPAGSELELRLEPDDFDTLTWPGNTYNYFGVSWSSNSTSRNINLAVNGQLGIGGAINLTALPTFTTLTLGSPQQDGQIGSLNEALNGWIRNIEYFPKALTTSALKILTGNVNVSY